MQAAAQNAVLAFPQRSRGMRETLFAALKNHRVPDALAQDLAREADGWPGYGERAALACALAARLRPAPIDFARARAIMLVGPHGAGKSACAAKIAHAAALAGRRIANFAAASGLGSILAGVAAPDALAIIDSEGFNPRNMRARAAFGSLDAAADELETIGVVSALGDAEETAEIVAAFGFHRVIVTGLDMAARLGALVGAVTQGARLAHVTRSPHDDGLLENLDPQTLAAMLLNQVKLA